MSDEGWKTRLRELQASVNLKRKSGDAARKAGREQDAARAYETALGFLDEIKALLKDPVRNRLDRFKEGADLPEDQRFLARELVETLGARGGILRRLDRGQEALENYQEGGRLESRFVPQSTYNRTNAIKLDLVTGPTGLEDVRADLVVLEQSLTGVTASNPDDGWAFADLGDCRALLGDVDGAERAYRSFLDKAGTRAPKTTLEVLASVVTALKVRSDRAAGDVQRSLERLQDRLRA